MIKEAVDALQGKADYSAVKQYINKKWEDVNEGTINAQLIVLSVNQQSRTQYHPNKNPAYPMALMTSFSPLAAVKSSNMIQMNMAFGKYTKQNPEA